MKVMDMGVDYKECAYNYNYGCNIIVIRCSWKGGSLKVMDMGVSNSMT